MISWLQQYQGYIVYPSLILGILYLWVTMPKRKIIRLEETKWNVEHAAITSQAVDVTKAAIKSR